MQVPSGKVKNVIHYILENKYISYPILTKVVARVFSVLATSAAVERKLNIEGNIITQKWTKLSPDTVNDIVFNYPLTKYKQKYNNPKTMK